VCREKVKDLLKSEDTRDMELRAISRQVPADVVHLCAAAATAPGVRASRADERCSFFLPALLYIMYSNKPRGVYLFKSFWGAKSDVLYYVLCVNPAGLI
jgi:hypothetical protein